MTNNKLEIFGSESDWKSLIFIAEGTAEEYLLELLIDNDLLIDELCVSEEWKRRIIKVDGKDKMTFTYADKKLNYSFKDYKNCKFILLADSVVGQNVSFAASSKDKASLVELFGPEYDKHILYISIEPTSEILLVAAMGFIKEYIKSKNDPITFLNEKGYKTKEIKSRTFIEKWIDNKNIKEMVKLLPKINSDFKDKNIVPLSEIIK